MTFNELQSSEPAFVSHEKFIKSKPKGCHKKLTDCSYSIANITLIVACVLALVFALKFILDDDLLYEYAEHLLSLRFYRQLIFIIVILPLVLIIPLFDAVSVFFLSGYGKHELGSSLLSVRLSYQILMGLLVFIGLAFVAPSTRHLSVRSQLEKEIFNHMRWRYQNDFSYQFLDRIQETYECCDEFWYRSNYHDKVPPSCAVRDGSFNNYFKRTCDDALATMISDRCLIIAFCLCAILLALATLIGIDIVELMSSSAERYDVSAAAATAATSTQETAAKSENVGESEEEGGGQSSSPVSAHTTSTAGSTRFYNGSQYRSVEHDDLIQEINNRLRASERKREAPLLIASGKGTGDPDGSDANDADERWPLTSGPAELPTKGNPILTRANYLYNRPQSPVFVPVSSSTAMTTTVKSPEMAGGGTSTFGGGGRPVTPTKGVLKKTSSFQKIDSEEEMDIEDIDSGETMRRDTQTRRSLLNSPAELPDTSA